MLLLRLVIWNSPGSRVKMCQRWLRFPLNGFWTILVALSL
jgi:hypothetical protein